MTDIALPGLPLAEPAEGPSDTPPAEPVAVPPSQRRRKIIVLFVLLAMALVLSAFAIWYLIFRQPISNVIPILDLTNPPAFTSATYGVTKPLAVAVTSDGSRVVVTQGGGDRTTVILDSAGIKVATLTPPAAVAASSSQLYVAINPVNGQIYTTDRTAGAVYRYNADGTYLGVFAAPASIGVWQPLGIAFDTKGNLYVTDAGGQTQRVHVFGPDGALLRDLGVTDALSFPNGIAVDSAGNVYVADSNNGRLMVYDPTGTRIGLVQRGAAQGNLGMPRGVAVDSKGRVYVVDSTGQSVQMYRAMQSGDPAPVYLTGFGQEGTIDGAFEFPNAVAVDGRGHVYVTDWNNDRIQTWSY